MLLAGEIKAELARIQPARACCRRAELAGLLHAAGTDGELRTLDHATARTAVHLAGSLRVTVGSPLLSARHLSGERHLPGERHHLRVRVDDPALRRWSWDGARACDRRAWMRGVLLASGSVSLASSGPHVEFVFADSPRADELRRRLADEGLHSASLERRGRHVVYLKGREEIAGLLRLAGASRGLLEWEADRVGRDVRNRLNRLLNAEEANLARTVRAADRQLRAVERLEADGVLDRLPYALREAANARRRHPDADLDTLAASIGATRSAMNHRLRRLVELADAEGDAARAAYPRRPRQRGRSAVCAGR
ncbi:MAG TPA: DNA-binding protein WhiA [Candidatus Limnocylindria bacterium]|nr:DNA-binding protein WhiA [Candidatus Limnocylindria bacterium]